MIQEWTDDIKKEMLASFFKTQCKDYNRCLEPLLKCNQKAIRAHSVQNSRILDNLVDNDHVNAFTRRIDKDTGPVIDYGLVGRNSATTFTGLCGTHDRDIFSPIDNEEINLENKLHLFLLAYRAVFRGLHAIMDGAMKIQTGYLKRIELGLEPKDELSDIGKIATERLMISWLTYRYKTDFDLAYIEKTYDDIHHDTFIFALEKPTIAVCSLFSIDNHLIDGDYLRVVLNVLPVTRDKTYVILSYRKKDSDHARTALDRVINSTGLHQRYEISRFILNNCENFVISPQYLDSWSDKKKETIRDYFIKTIFEGDMEYESPELYLL